MVSPQELLEKSVFSAGENPVFLDVRTIPEYIEGHIPNAQHLDFYGEGFLDHVQELKKYAVYVVYCRSGGRSLQAVQLMKTLGFEKIYNLEGGLAVWENVGGPIVEEVVE